MLWLKRPVGGDPDIVRLLFGKFGQFHADLLQMQTREGIDAR